MRIAIWLLAAAVVVITVIAGHWMSLNKLLRFEVQQLEQQNTALEVALARVSTDRCEPHSPLAEQTLQELCIAYADHFGAKEPQVARKREVDGWVDERLSSNVRQKYRLFIAQINLSAQEKEALLSLLMQRETLLNAPTHSFHLANEDSAALVQEQQAALADIDERIGALLNQDDRANFQLMKDSEFEQYQLQELQAQLTDSQKLSVDQQAQLLKMKLLATEQLYAALEQASIDWQSETAEVKKQRLLELVNQTKFNYFQDAAMLLTDVQLERFKQLEESVFSDLVNSLAVQL